MQNNFSKLYILNNIGVLFLPIVISGHPQHKQRWRPSHSAKRRHNYVSMTSRRATIIELTQFDWTSDDTKLVKLSKTNGDEKCGRTCWHDMNSGSSTKTGTWTILSLFITLLSTTKHFETNASIYLIVSIYLSSITS